MAVPSKLSNEEKERLMKMNNAFLYNVGYEHINNICDETERLLDKYRDIKVPESLDQWFTDFNKKLERKNRLAIIREIALICSKRIAILLIIVCIACLCVTLSVEAFRVRFFNLVIETYQKFSIVSQEEKNTNELKYELPSNWAGCYYPGYLPEGYSLTDIRELNDAKYMLFSNSDGKEIRFVQGSINLQSQIDTEKGKVIEVEIKGNTGILVVK